MTYYEIGPDAGLDDRHLAVGAWVLGPKAESFELLRSVFESTFILKTTFHSTLDAGQVSFQRGYHDTRSRILGSYYNLEQTLNTILVSEISGSLIDGKFFPAVIGCKYDVFATPCRTYNEQILLPRCMTTTM